MADRLRVAIADDHPLFREGVVHTLRSSNFVEVVGEAGSAEDGHPHRKGGAPGYHAARCRYAGRWDRGGPFNCAGALPRQDCSRIMTVASPESLPLREPGGGQDEAGEHGYEGRAACCGERAIQGERTATTRLRIDNPPINSGSDLLGLARSAAWLR